MIPSNIDKFSLDWIRADRKVKLSKEHPEADAFQQMCGNILSDPVYKKASGLNLNLISFTTRGRDGAIDHFAFIDKNETAIVECKKNNSVENSLIEIRKLKDKLLRNLNGKNALKAYRNTSRFDELTKETKDRLEEAKNLLENIIY